jgi:hypothetical protein
LRKTPTTWPGSLERQSDPSTHRTLASFPFDRSADRYSLPSSNIATVFARIEFTGAPDGPAAQDRSPP